MAQIDLQRLIKLFGAPDIKNNITAANGEILNRAYPNRQVPVVPALSVGSGEVLPDTPPILRPDRTQIGQSLIAPQMPNEQNFAIEEPPPSAMIAPQIQSAQAQIAAPDAYAGIVPQNIHYAGDAPPLTPDRSAAGQPLIAPQMPENVEEAPSNAFISARPPSQITQNKINAIGRKDYSKAQYDENGNIVKEAGADRDKKWSLGEKIASTLMGVANGLASGGGLIGAAAGGIKAGTNRNFMEQRGDAEQMNRLVPQLQQQQQQETFQTAQTARNAQTDEIKRKPQAEKDKFQRDIYAEAQKQAGRIEALQMKEAAEGKKWKSTMRNGKYFKQYGDGREEPLLDEKGVQEIELTKVPVKTTVGGQTVYTTGDKEIDREISANYRQAVLDMQAGKYNAEALSDYDKTLQIYTANEADRQQKVTELTATGNSKINQHYNKLGEVKSLSQEIARFDNQISSIQSQINDPKSLADKDELAKQIKELNDKRSGQITKRDQANTEALNLKEEGNALMNQAVNSKPLPVPKRPAANLTAPSVSGGRYKGMNFPSPNVIKQQFPGKSEDDIRRIVTAQGGTFTK